MRTDKAGCPGGGKDSYGKGSTIKKRGEANHSLSPLLIDLQQMIKAEEIEVVVKEKISYNLLSIFMQRQYGKRGIRRK